MASDKRRAYILRVQIHDDSGKAVGCIEARLPADALRFIVGGARPRQRAEEVGHARAPDRESEQRVASAERSLRAGDRSPGGATPEAEGTHRGSPSGAQTGELAMSMQQRKLLFRLAYSMGYDNDTATARILDAIGVQRFEHATRTMASRAIDALKFEQETRRLNQSNGTFHA